MNNKSIPWADACALIALFFMMTLSVYGATTPPDTDPPEYECGNGVCSADEREAGTCPADCDTTDPPEYECGDDICSAYEMEAGTCPLDCSASPNDDEEDDDEDSGGSSGGGSSSRNLLIQRILEQLVAVLTELINLIIAQRGA